MGPIHTLADFLDMVRRRATVIFWVVVLGCIASVVFALSQPHVYEASEVIQVEQPKISDDLAPSTVDSSAARRLQLIQQQLMARGHLQEVIDTFGIYEGLPLRPTEKINLLRQSVTINGVAAVREGFADDGAISVLTITAQMDDAQLARDVAHAFADRTRELAEARREEQTRETLEFFQAQEEALLADVAELEQELAAFRSQNDLSIEGSLEFRRSELSSLNDALLELDREIITAELALQNIDRSGNTRAATVAREEEELNRQLSSLNTQRRLLEQRRETLSSSIESTPEVERTLAEFDRRMALLRDQLDGVAARRSEAEVGFTMETASSGERFITLEEAQVPDLPISTSRKMIALMGGVASVGLALAIAFLLDLRRPVIRTSRQMQRETGLMPVVAIPNSAEPDKGTGAAFTDFFKSRWESGRRGRRSRTAETRET